MTKEQLIALRGTDIAVNEDGDFIFTKRNRKGTKVYGPVSFREAMIICWNVMKDYQEEKNNE